MEPFDQPQTLLHEPYRQEVPDEKYPPRGLLIEMKWIQKSLSGEKIWELRGERTKSTGIIGQKKGKYGPGSKSQLEYSRWRNSRTHAMDYGECYSIISFQYKGIAQSTGLCHKKPWFFECCY